MRGLQTMNEWIMWAVQGLVATAMGIISYLWKRDKDRLERDIEQLKKEVKELPFVYTTREDFIRATAAIDRKLDKIYDCITQQKKEI